MVSVVNRIKAIKQPRGGYINPKDLERIQFDDGIELGPESIHPSTTGLIIDYLTRFNQGSPVKKAFEISFMGADLAGRTKYAEKYAKGIKGLDDESINNACKLVWYDQVYRAGIFPPGEYEGVADKQTCENVRTMISRSDKFFEDFGPVVLDGATFPGGYTKTVDAGDCDFVTSDTLWDFKVSVKEPTKEHTLQLAMYYLMGKRSIVREFASVSRIGVFNPRLNAAFVLDMGSVPADVIKAIENDVICF